MVKISLNEGLKTINEETIVVKASDGEEFELDPRASGVKTGWAVVANPAEFPSGHELFDPNWPVEDGETVIEVEENYPNAITVGDAWHEFESVRGKEISSMRKKYPHIDFGEETSWERKRREEEEELAKMQEPEAGEDLPRHSSMRRNESKDLEKLRSIIKEECRNVLKQTKDEKLA